MAVIIITFALLLAGVGGGGQVEVQEAVVKMVVQGQTVQQQQEVDGSGLSSGTGEGAKAEHDSTVMSYWSRVGGGAIHVSYILNISVWILGVTGGGILVSGVGSRGDGVSGCA